MGEQVDLARTQRVSIQAGVRGLQSLQEHLGRKTQDVQGVRCDGLSKGGVQDYWSQRGSTAKIWELKPIGGSR